MIACRLESLTRKVVRRGRFGNASRDIRLISGCVPGPENVRGFRAETFGEGAVFLRILAGALRKEFQFQFVV